MERRKHLLSGSLSKAAFICLLAVAVALPAFSQSIDNEFQLRNTFRVTKKIAKGLRIEVRPELRWTGGEGLDKYIISTGFRYKPVDYLSFSAQYRIVGNRKEEQETEFLGRYQFSLTGSNEFGRWEPGVRVAFTNYTDENEDGMFLRYRASLDYDIAHCKLTPGAGFEIYHDLDQSNIYKYRTRIDLKYKISGKLSVSTGYRLDYFMNEGKNRHICRVGLNYKL